MKRLKGNTLIEVLIGLSLLSLVFLIGMKALEGITGIHSPVQEFRTQALLSLYMQKELLLIPFEEEVETQGRRLERKAIWLDEKQGLVLLELSCFWGEQKVRERKKIIRVN
ncbi:MAG: prepilin-type N-terminal cleavage/methylation domain-containing protein [Bacteroidota bacterium]